MNSRENRANNQKNGKTNNLDPKFYTAPLNEKRIGFIIWFFLTPGLVISLSAINILILIVVMFQTEDRGGFLQLIWSNIQRGFVSSFFTILLGIGILILYGAVKQSFNIRIENSNFFGKIENI